MMLIVQYHKNTEFNIVGSLLIHTVMYSFLTAQTVVDNKPYDNDVPVSK